ncbi:hypothetical protein [Gracilimonas tropica]|uniref:hypothetical protein n=1 Tax=Gracilimonas tropica TaxID=454600 RepID=UPI00035F3E11|nr:hypothetical protein [Gracilimonas tropica]
MNKKEKKIIPCKHCGEPAVSEFTMFCKRCYEVRSKVDQLMKSNPDAALDLLLEKLAKITEFRIRKRDYEHIKKLDYKPLKFPDPISKAPAELNVTTASFYTIHQITRHSVSGAYHIKLLEDIEFHNLKRMSGSLLCKGYFDDTKNVYETDHEITCKKCLRMAKSLERRKISLKYLSKSEAKEFTEKVNKQIYGY